MHAQLILVDLFLHGKLPFRNGYCKTSSLPASRGVVKNTSTQSDPNVTASPYKRSFKLQTVFFCWRPRNGAVLSTFDWTSVRVRSLHRSLMNSHAHVVGGLRVCAGEGVEVNEARLELGERVAARIDLPTRVDGNDHTPVVAADEAIVLCLA